MKFGARVKNGVLVIDDQRGYGRCITSHEGHAVTLSLTRMQNRRSLQANRYYWGVVIHYLSEYTGYDAEEMHEALAMKFLRIEDCPLTGAPRRARTPETNSAQFARYVDDCIRFAAELGIVIPDANQAEDTVLA